ncbi:Guanine nucleotide-binding protein G(s) subunit alpha [Halotydeus destructor]|nr:Guanine nucleotide-binding protein G(s) subunit alpha [Halotydeus destructor]
MPTPMKCFSPPDPGHRASKELDKKINQWMKVYKKAIKLLLLGAGESGKTTIIKQMKILHDRGFTLEERMSKVNQIRHNILESIKEITSNMAFLQPSIELADESNQESFDFIADIDIFTEYEYGDKFYYHVRRLWADSGVRESYRRSNEYHLIDCARYFLDKLEVVKDANYVPSDQDVLRCRRRTSDIQKIEFEVQIPSKYGGKSQAFWMFDVGGQRGERRKWIQVFEGITAVLFLVASSSFDTKIREDNETNRLAESLALFEEVWSSRFLRDSGFILFLNKQDILREKVRNGARLEQYFEEYSGYQISSHDFHHNTDTDIEYVRARSFIRDKFLAISKNNSRKQSNPADYYVDNRKRECFSHYTTATDTDNIKKVFDDVHVMIIMMNLSKITPT